MIVLGETLSETFTLPSLTTGQTFTRVASYINQVSSVFAPTFTEISGGAYRYSYTPAVAGFFEWVGTSSTSSEKVTINFDVEATGVTVTVSAATSGALTRTLQKLRRDIADKLDDYVALTATANGNAGATTLIDTYHINAGTEHFNGRDLLCINGTNAGLKRRITATVDTTGTLTLNSALTAQTLTNDTFDVFNRRGVGFPAERYTRAINNAINAAFPSAVIQVDATITGAFDADTPEIVIPAAVTEVITLEAQDSNGDWHVVPKARSRGGDGWFADPSDGGLRLHGARAWATDTLSLRVFGYGRQDELSAESDTCAIRPEFIVAHAAYHLALAAVGNNEMSLRVNNLKKELDEQRIAISVLREPHTAKVRAA